MRLRDLLIEAWRNVISGAARPIFGIMLAVLPLGALVAAEVLAVAAAERTADKFRDGLAAVLVIDSPVGVSGSACDRLAAVTGVTRAGALRGTGRPLVPASTPQTKIPLFEATEGLATFLGVDLHRGVAVEESVAAAYGRAAGTPWDTTRGTVVVSGTYPFPADGRNPQLQYAVIGQGPPQARYDQCWVEVWPFDPTTSSLLYSALADGIDPANATTVQLNPSLGSTLDARVQFTDRPSRFAGFLAAGWGAIATLGIARLRRLELAMARHHGARPQELALLLVCEAILWCVPSGLIATAALTLLVDNHQITHASAWHGAVVLTAGLTGVILGNAGGGLLAREKQLFTYFKKRT